MRTFAVLLLVVLGGATASCNHDRPRPDTALITSAATVAGPAATPPTTPPVQIEMKNVRLHADDGIVLEVAYLRGEMVSRVSGRPPVFDDQRSYVLRVRSAEVAMDMPSLTNLMNRHVFGYDHAPLSGIGIEIDEGRLKMKATLHKGIPVPISMKAGVVATADGRLRMQTEKVSALGVPAKKLMSLFGLELDDVVDLKKRRGIEIDDNDVVITPGQVLPPPELQGHLSQVRIVNGKLQQTFGTPGVAAEKLSAPEFSSRNYIYFSGSDIRFGKLTMSNADLQLIDDDARDPFDFFPARYNRQLVAGYSKNTPSGGLRTYMPDYGDLDRVKSLKPVSR